MTATWPRHPAKRIVDLLVSSAALVTLSPVMGAVALSIRCLMGKPVLYRQLRTGLDGEVFPLYKFRTMLPEHDDSGRAIPEEQRITRLGQMLRSTSLDELPQLLHILLGQMSLVGPRPLLPDYLHRYTTEQARRLTVRPGLTGLAQVSGRNELSWVDKFDLDVQYVDHADAWMDLKILAGTVAKVLRSEGIRTDGHATSPYFMGDVQSATDDAENGRPGT